MSPRTALTIGMATYDDYTGVWFTLTRLREQLTLLGCLADVQLLVVDNHPEGPEAEPVKNLVTGLGGKYVAMEQPKGTAPPRGRIFDEAAGEWVLVLDSHVWLTEGVLQRLLEWIDGNTSLGFFQGVCMRSKLVNGDGSPAISWTHWASRWGEDGLYGKSAVNPAASDPQSEPFKIPAGGLGLFLCRRDAWLGFHPKFRGFGVEGYLQAKWRNAGRDCWCLPFLRWVHCFRPKTVSAPYATGWRDRTWNYLCSHAELGFPRLSDLRTHHVEKSGRTSVKDWRSMLDELGINEAATLAKEAGKAPVSVSKSGGPGSELKALLASLGITPDGNCDCNKKALQMDAWGPEKCRENYHTIIGWMKDGQSRWGWSGAFATIKAAPAALASGLAMQVNWLDPIPGLVELAIQRSESKKQAA